MTLSDNPDRSLVGMAHTIAAAVSALPDVARLHPGAVGEIATYGRGERVGGVRIHGNDELRIGIHVVVRYARPLPDVVSAVRAAVGTALRSVPGHDVADAVIDVRVADLELPQVPS